MSLSTACGPMPIFSSTGETMPSRSSTRAASRCAGASSGLPCSEASSFARWTASCALTVNLSQRMAMMSLLLTLKFISTHCQLQNKAREAPVLPPPAEFTVRVGTGDSPVRPDKARQLPLRGFGHALRLFAFKRLLSADVYLDLLRLGFSFLRQLDLQHALVIVSLDIIMVDRRGQIEGTSKAAILTLHAAVVLFFFFLLELALTVHGQGVVLDADINVLLVDARHFDFQGDIVLVLVDVHGRGKCGRG